MECTVCGVLALLLRSWYVLEYLFLSLLVLTFLIEDGRSLSLPATGWQVNDGMLPAVLLHSRVSTCHMVVTVLTTYVLYFCLFSILLFDAILGPFCYTLKPCNLSSSTHSSLINSCSTYWWSLAISNCTVNFKLFVMVDFTIILLPCDYVHGSGSLCIGCCYYPRPRSCIISRSCPRYTAFLHFSILFGGTVHYVSAGPASVEIKNIWSSCFVLSSISGDLFFRCCWM